MAVREITRVQVYNSGLEVINACSRINNSTNLQVCVKGLPEVKQLPSAPVPSFTYSQTWLAHDIIS